MGASERLTNVREPPIPDVSDVPCQENRRTSAAGREHEDRSRPVGLVVELDGGQHSEQVAYDERRTADLEGLGLRVIRFWNSAVLTNRDGVCATILDACGGEHPSMGPG